MSMMQKRLVSTGIAFGLSLYPFLAGAGSSGAEEVKGKRAFPAVDVGKVLKGVVHLGDNDIRFHTKNGIVVFIDPITGPTDSLVIKTGFVKPDLILITHPHEDHFQPGVLQDYLKANPKAVLAGPAEVARLAQEKGINGMKTVAPGQDYTMAGVDFRAMPAYFLEGNSHPKTGQWVGYLLQLNGKRYDITGDTQPLPEMAEVKADVLFPLLYGCGGNLDLAVKMAELSKASVVVPVHTGGREEIIRKYIDKLPDGVHGAYYLKGHLIVVK